MPDRFTEDEIYDDSKLIEFDYAFLSESMATLSGKSCSSNDIVCQSKHILICLDDYVCDVSQKGICYVTLMALEKILRWSFDGHGNRTKLWLTRNTPCQNQLD